MMNVRKQIPNILTTLRIMCSLGILFCRPLSAMFILLYIIAGISDMLDGYTARKFQVASFFGEKYDSVADVLFIGICLFKILPVLDLKAWHIVWIGMITMVKGINLLLSFFYHRKRKFLHTTANRITGLMLFLSPLFMVCVNETYIVSFLCVVATFAALQEGNFIRTGKMESEIEEKIP